jgi:hypothetical protein
MNKGYKPLPDWASDTSVLDDRTRTILLGCRVRNKTTEELVFLQKTMAMRDKTYGQTFEDNLIAFYDECMQENGGKTWGITVAKAKVEAEAAEKARLDEVMVEKKKAFRYNRISVLTFIAFGLYFWLR